MIEELAKKLEKIFEGKNPDSDENGWYCDEIGCENYKSCEHCIVDKQLTPIIRAEIEKAEPPERWNEVYQRAFRMSREIILKLFE